MRKLSCIVGAKKTSENTNPKCLQFAAKIKGSPFQYFWNVYVCIGKVSESNVTPPHVHSVCTYGLYHVLSGLSSHGVKGGTVVDV